MYVPVAENGARLLLEAVARLLAVPDGARQWELAAHAVLADSAERASFHVLGLHVVSGEPELLQLGVIVRHEVVVLKYFVEVTKAALVIGDDRLRLQHTLVLVQVVTLGQRPEETRQPIDRVRLLQHLAHACHLLLCEAERRRVDVLCGIERGCRRSGRGLRRHGRV